MDEIEHAALDGGLQQAGLERRKTTWTVVISVFMADDFADVKHRVSY